MRQPVASPRFSPAIYPRPVKPEHRIGAHTACPNPRGVRPLGPGARAGALQALRSFNGSLAHDKRYADRAFWVDLRLNKHLTPFGIRERAHPRSPRWIVQGSHGPRPHYSAPPGAPCSPKVIRRTWAITVGPAHFASASLPMTYYLLQRRGHWLVWYWY